MSLQFCVSKAHRHRFYFFDLVAKATLVLCSTLAVCQALLTRVDSHSVDIVAMLDVLCYFTCNDLSAVFGAASRALRPGGLFALSTECLEKAEDPKTGWCSSWPLQTSSWLWRCCGRLQLQIQRHVGTARLWIRQVVNAQR